jgi:hypothetical protein
LSGRVRSQNRRRPRTKDQRRSERRDSCWRREQETRAGSIIALRPAILLAAATHWSRRHSFPGRSANRCISQCRYLSVTVHRGPKPFLFPEKTERPRRVRGPRGNPNSRFDPPGRAFSRFLRPAEAKRAYVFRLPTKGSKIFSHTVISTLENRLYFKPSKTERNARPAARYFQTFQRSADRNPPSSRSRAIQRLCHPRESPVRSFAMTTKTYF